MEYGINSSSIILEINKVRTQPKTYVKKFENLLKNFSGNILTIPNKKNRLITMEGANAFKESIEFLSSQSPLNRLESDTNLTKAAEAIAEEFSRTRENSNMGQNKIHDIIHRYGNSEGNVGISIDFGNDDVEMLIISLINDDGRRDRKNRNMMFNYNYNKIGCSSKFSKFHKNVAVILYAIEFTSERSPNNYNYYGVNKINYVNEDVVGLDPKIDLFTDSAKRGDSKYSFMNKNYYETGHDCYNYDYPAGNVYKINKNDPDMRDVRKVEKNEKFIFENGKRVKLVSIKKYMNNGEIKTTYEKFNL